MSRAVVSPIHFGGLGRRSFVNAGQVVVFTKQFIETFESQGLAQAQGFRPALREYDAGRQYGAVAGSYASRILARFAAVTELLD